jgi:hypothetical protein
MDKKIKQKEVRVGKEHGLKVGCETESWKLLSRQGLPSKL